MTACVVGYIQEPPFSKPINSVTEMALAWDSSFLALFTDTGMLWIGKTVDLQVIKL